MGSTPTSVASLLGIKRALITVQVMGNNPDNGEICTMYLQSISNIKHVK